MKRMRPKETSSSRKIRAVDALAITDGEVNFLWWFIQGSIMNPETWEKLMRGGGFCERHAWVHLSVEMAFRDLYLLGPAILYRALIDRSLRAFQQSRPASPTRLGRRLRPTGPCFLCDMRVDPAASGVSSQQRLERGRDTGALRAFAAKLAPLWRDQVCGVCGEKRDDDPGASRCRSHLLTDIQAGRQVDLAGRQAVLEDLASRLEVYERSFTLRQRRPATDSDRAAFLAAVGWCSGWRPLLALLG
jgi:hypothetical protein